MATINEKKFDKFVWIDICDPDQESLQKITADYNLDVFQIRDSVEQGHLPKFEHNNDYSFLILRSFTANLEDRITSINGLSNKIAFFYCASKLITIHRTHYSFLEFNYETHGHPEEVLLSIINHMIKSFVAPVKVLSTDTDELERVIFLNDYTKISLEELYFLKTETRVTKKLLLITQNVVSQIEVEEKHRTALQDIKDKLMRLILEYDEVSESSNNLLNTFMSVNAQKSNDVMKLLTIFSAFFLPLTFIAGVYGMNFEHMPELKYVNGYYITLVSMVVVCIVIFQWFKRKKIL
jgi:magnesium transporter